MIPATMAALELPSPRANGMRLTMWYLSGGMGFAAVSNAALTPVTRRFEASLGISAAPSPSAVISKASARDTVTSVQRSTASPMQSYLSSCESAKRLENQSPEACFGDRCNRESYPGPQLADVAGTRTVTDCRGIEFSSSTAIRDAMRRRMRSS